MSTEKKLTAVEWLHEEIRWNVSNSDKLIEIFRIAKEKEKKQIIDFGETAIQTDFYVKYESVEDYYNQTFKN
jgi:hypothetical protein